MSSPDKNAGPKICQSVLYNSAGTIVAGIIYGVNSGGTVNLNAFTSAGASNVSSAGYSPSAVTSNTWGYPDFV